MVSEGSPGRPSRSSGATLGAPWAVLGRSWDALGRSWGALGVLWDALGALFGRSWALLGAPQPFMGDLGSNFGPPEVDFGYLQGSIFDFRGSIGE